jgi:hypothetical protein
MRDFASSDRRIFSLENKASRWRRIHSSHWKQNRIVEDFSCLPLKTRQQMRTLTLDYHN